MTLWVFGYGSLLWNPGFEVAEAVIGTLPGYSRSFCMHSVHYRGTQDAPGLVLALASQPKGACDGMALRVADGHEDATLAYLRERELISYAYLETWLPVALSDGRNVEALIFVMNEDHDQFCGHLPMEEQAQIIAKARGTSGPNAEYLFNTADHLRKVGLNDPAIEWLADRVRNIAS